MEQDDWFLLCSLSPSLSFSLSLSGSFFLLLSLSLSLTVSWGVNNKNVHECFSRENAPSLKCVRTRENERLQDGATLVKKERKLEVNSNLIRIPGFIKMGHGCCPTKL